MKYKVGDYVLVKPELHDKCGVISFDNMVCGKVVEIVKISNCNYPYVIKTLCDDIACEGVLWDGDIKGLVVGNRIIKESE